MAHLQVAHAVGRNPSVQMAGGDFVQPGGQYHFPSALGAVTVVSDDVNDTVGGTGAHSVFIFASDATHVSQIMLVNLNGTTPVAGFLPINSGNPSGHALRVSGITIAGCGSTASNIGTITVKVAGTVVNIIEPTFGNAHQLAFTLGVPGTLIRVNAELISDTPNVSATVATMTRSPGPNTCWKTLDVMHLSPKAERIFEVTSFNADQQPGLNFIVGTDIKMTILSASKNDVAIMAHMQLLVEEFSPGGIQV